MLSHHYHRLSFLQWLFLSKLLQYLGFCDVIWLFFDHLPHNLALLHSALQHSYLVPLNHKSLTDIRRRSSLTPSMNGWWRAGGLWEGFWSGGSRLACPRPHSQVPARWRILIGRLGCRAQGLAPWRWWIQSVASIADRLNINEDNGKQRSKIIKDAVQKYTCTMHVIYWFYKDTQI